jgi:hypothetical protein
MRLYIHLVQGFASCLVDAKFNPSQRVIYSNLLLMTSSLVVS